MGAGSGGKHAGDCQASPGAAVGELGLGQGRQQLLSQPKYKYNYNYKHIAHAPSLTLMPFFCIELFLIFFASLCCLVITLLAKTAVKLNAFQKKSVLSRHNGFNLICKTVISIVKKHLQVLCFNF